MSENEKQSWIEFMKKIGCTINGYRHMTKKEELEIGWAVYMHHIWDRLWSELPKAEALGFLDYA